MAYRKGLTKMSRIGNVGVRSWGLKLVPRCKKPVFSKRSELGSNKKRSDTSGSKGKTLLMGK